MMITMGYIREMEAKNYIKSAGDLDVLATRFMSKNDIEGSDLWQSGFRFAETNLIEVLSVVIKENKELSAIKMSLGHEDLLERIKTLEHIITNKEQIIKDSRGMVNTSYLVVCEKNALLRDCKEFFTKLGEVFGFDGMSELLKRFD